MRSSRELARIAEPATTGLSMTTPSIGERIGTYSIAWPLRAIARINSSGMSSNRSRLRAALASAPDGLRRTASRYSSWAASRSGP